MPSKLLKHIAHGMAAAIACMLFVGDAQPAHAGDAYTLVASLVKSKGYVVGARLSQSGLYRFSHDTTWVHFGWNHPRISAIDQDKGTPSRFFAAAGNGILRSNSHATDWKIVSGWDYTEGLAVAIDPNNPQRVLASCAYGIWRTEDGGDTWQRTSEGLKSGYTDRLVADQQTPNRFLAANEHGLFASTDAGSNWHSIAAAGLMMHDLDQSRLNADIWLTGGEKAGAYLSTDNGQQWQPLAAPIAGKTIVGVALDWHDAGLMAICGWDAGVFLSRDQGATWTQIGDKLPTKHIYDLIFDRNSPGVLHVGTFEEGFYVTRDDGETWTFTGLSGAIPFDMVYLPTHDEN